MPGKNEPKRTKPDHVIAHRIATRPAPLPPAEEGSIKKREDRSPRFRLKLKLQLVTATSTQPVPPC